MRAHDLAGALDVRSETVRRWMIRLGRWPFPGSGPSGAVLTDDDVRAVVVALATADYDAQAAPSSRTTQRAIFAAGCALEHPWASYILATPDWATPHESPESTIATWHAKGTPVAAIVSVADVMGRLSEQAA